MLFGYVYMRDSLFSAWLTCTNKISCFVFVYIQSFVMLNLSFSSHLLCNSIIKRYSSFVAFPIKVNGEAVNVVQAIWAKEKTAVTEEQYDDFYRFIANTYDKPVYR